MAQEKETEEPQHRKITVPCFHLVQQFYLGLCVCVCVCVPFTSIIECRGEPGRTVQNRGEQSVVALLG